MRIGPIAAGVQSSAHLAWLPPCRFAQRSASLPDHVSGCSHDVIA